MSDQRVSASEAWRRIAIYRHHNAGHLKLLADICLYDGGVAYQSDRSHLHTPLPFTLGEGMLDNPQRQICAYRYAGDFLSAFPAHFREHFPLKSIAEWWLIGYDKAHQDDLNRIAKQTQ